MKKSNWGKLIGRAVVEVLLFSTLTGCAYAATERVLPQMEGAEISASSAVAEQALSTPHPVQESVTEEQRIMQSIPAEGLWGEGIFEEMTLEDAMETGNIVLRLDTTYEEEGLGGLLPGLGQGTWYGVDVDGISYIYGHYSEIDRTDYFTYIITDEKYQLGNGLQVGLGKEEALALCPELVEVELTAEDRHWNGICYPACWIDQFEYALVVDLENNLDDLPVYLALFMQEEKVVAISPYYPTAG